MRMSSSSPDFKARTDSIEHLRQSAHFTHGVVDAQDLTEVLAAWQEPCGV